MPEITWDTLYETDTACPRCGSQNLEFRTLREHTESYRGGEFQWIEAVSEDAEVVVLAVDCIGCGADLLDRYDTGVAAIHAALDSISK